MKRRLMRFLAGMAIAVGLLTWYHLSRDNPFDKSDVFAPYIEHAAHDTLPADEEESADD